MEDNLYTLTYELLSEIKQNDYAQTCELENYFNRVSKELNLRSLRNFVNFNFTNPETVSAVCRKDSTMRIDFGKILLRSKGTPYFDGLDLTTCNQTNNYILKVLYLFFSEIVHDYQSRPNSNINPIIRNSMDIKLSYWEQFVLNHDLFPCEQEARVKGLTILYYILRNKFAKNIDSLNAFYLDELVANYSGDISLYEKFRIVFSESVYDDPAFIENQKTLYQKLCLGLSFNKDNLESLKTSVIDFEDKKEMPKMLKKTIDL